MSTRRKPGDPAENAPDEGTALEQGTLDPVDEAGAASFPASDPPGWIPLHPGTPAPAKGPRDGRSAGPTPATRT
ncbi:MAG: hypothetical protein K0S96_1197 [Geminicoccaceae bacterium]|jgi:hypothetical protein|nr:hypothetical protein [Geminicoccaceae bacterium]